MAVDDLWRLAFSYTSQGQLHVNVMYGKQITNTAGSDAQAVASYMATALRDVYNQAIARPERGQIVNVQATKVSRLFSDTAEGSANWGIDGPNETPLPPATAVTIRLRTGLAGPTRRGRIFMGGIPSIWVQSGVLSSLGVTGYSNFMIRLRDAMIGSGCATGIQLGVFSRKRYSIISNPFDEYWKPVIQLAAVGAIGTMRSRKYGVGQ